MTDSTPQQMLTQTSKVSRALLPLNGLGLMLQGLWMALRGGKLQ